MPKKRKKLTLKQILLREEKRLIDEGKKVVEIETGKKLRLNRIKEVYKGRHGTFFRIGIGSYKGRNYLHYHYAPEETIIRIKYVNDYSHNPRKIIRTKIKK